MKAPQERKCLWCSTPVPAGHPRCCDARCFALMKWMGWLWEEPEKSRLIAKEQREMPYDNTNSGALFRNDGDTRKSEYGGSVSTTCPHCGASTEWWLNAWVKERKKDGRKFFSLKLKPKREGAAAQVEGSDTSDAKPDGHP